MEAVKQYLCRRFSPFVKYSFSNGLYWDESSDRFVSVTSIHYYPWCATYYLGQGAQIILAIYLYMLCYGESDIPELDQNNASFLESQHDQKLIIGTGLMIWLIITTIVTAGSLTIQYQHEITETTNQLFKLDATFKQKFPGALSRPSSKLEDVFFWVCWLPLTAPFVFGLAMLHPSYPLKTMIENAFEIELTIVSPITWLIIFIQFWGVVGLVGVVMGMVLPLLAVFMVCRNWLLDGSLQISEISHEQNEQFDTTQLGHVEESDLIWIHRSLQLLSGLCNLPLATLRIAAHSAGVLMIFVISSFTLLKEGRSLLSNGSVLGYSMAGVLLMGILVGPLVFFIECFIIDELETRWCTYKESILRCSLRKKPIYKAAVSFRKITLLTTYPFCNVNRSTFLEWINVGINNIVNLLIGF